MKRCPTCQKTFDDNMRFCQTDGTPLVEDAPPADPYKTMVASREDIQAALNAPAQESQSAQAGIGAPDEEPLEIPSSPPPSSPASEFETKLAGRDDAQVIEIPPLAEAPQPEPPRFNEPSAPPPPSFDSTPASPFSAPGSSGTGDFPTTPPIPSPFSAPKSASFEPPAASYSAEPEAARPEEEEDEKTYFEPAQVPQSYGEPEQLPATPQYADPEPAPAQQFNPFNQQSAPQSAQMAQSEWAPPPSPVQSSPAMSSPSPGAGSAKVNQTLSIVSLIAGILGLTICCGSLVPSLVAIITGFMGRSKANSNPQQYGGAGLALAGIIMGVIGLLGGIVVLLMYLPMIIAIMSGGFR